MWGIDIAKEKHFAVVMNEKQEVLVRPFGFENNMTGFRKLIDVLEEYDRSELVVGMESTAHYAEALLVFLTGKGFPCSLINPLQTAVLRNAGIRKTKTDRVDTQLIVKSMIVNGYRILMQGEILDEIDSIIKTNPRIGTNNAAAIISEYGDVSRFHNPSQMTAYAGLDPVINQSGYFNASSTRMSKRGSKNLRFALLNAAFQLTKISSTFKEYYDKKRAEGKNHYNALGHTAHKLIRVIFHLTHSNTVFSLPKDYHFEGIVRQCLALARLFFGQRLFFGR